MKETEHEREDGRERDDERISSRFLYLLGNKLPIVSEECKVKEI